MAAAMAGSFLSAGDVRLSSFKRCQAKKPECFCILGNEIFLPKSATLKRVRFAPNRKGKFTVEASYSQEGERSSNGSVFVGGFILGGLIVGALGCIYAPQISRALAGADRKDLMKKLPKFIYDEDKALERNRKILASKIEQLNSAIDDVSSQLRPEYSPNTGAYELADDLES
ncbi:uncharacterized protein LOC144710585 [Wolffia australiana]